MQQDRAFRLYPTLATAPRRVRFPRAPAEADPEVINLSRYVIAAFTLVFELANDARQARSALATASAPSSLPPAPLYYLSSRRCMSSSVACCLMHVDVCSNKLRPCV